ncbi:MAG: NAD(P)-dependent oxidoreductase, partial [Acidobacteria bacterium]|nr:NAD(P)-dependent oxidoreductase [Acidobacteriota bacterium]
MRVGFIGLGIMGQPQARNLLRAGFALTVATRTPGKAARFAAENRELGDVRAVDAPADVARECEIIITMVTDTPDVVAVAYGDDGIFATAKPSTIVIDMSTISPSVTRDLATKAMQQGIFWLDAPVSGG